MGQKGHVKWGRMAVSCLPYRSPDQKLETCLGKEENRILVLLFYVSLFVIQSNILGVIFKVLRAEILLQIKSYTGTSYMTQMRVESFWQMGRCRWAWWVHPGLILPAWLLSNPGALWDTGSSKQNFNINALEKECCEWWEAQVPTLLASSCFLSLLHIHLFQPFSAHSALPTNSKQNLWLCFLPVGQWSFITAQI